MVLKTALAWQNKFLYLLVDERYVLLLKLILPLVPIFAIFWESTRVPESLFTEIITVCGIFMGFSTWVLTAPMPYGLDKSEYEKTFPERFREYLLHYVENRIKSKDASEEEKSKLRALLEDKKKVSQMAEELSRPLLRGFESWVSNIIAGSFWLFIIAPFAISITLAMVGLSHDGWLLYWMGVLATYAMFFGIINSTWEIMRLKTRFNFSNFQQ